MVVSSKFRRASGTIRYSKMMPITIKGQTRQEIGSLLTVIRTGKSRGITRNAVSGRYGTRGL